MTFHVLQFMHRVIIVKRPAVAIAIFLLLASSALAAQGQGSAGNTAAIRGTVIDAKTSQPVNGATVSLRALQASGESNSTTTTADGRFSFTGLSAGRYGLNASHMGYLDSGERRRGLAAAASPSEATVSVTAGQDVGDTVLRLTPTGVIAGRITNERDEPMPGVQVQTLKSSYANGYREFIDARAGFTDDRGEFRVWGLAPGQYYVRATNPRRWSGGAATREVYVPLFYPGVSDPGRSQAVELHPGEELSGINLALTPAHTVRVRGRVLTANGAPAKSAQVTLASVSGSGGYSVEAGTDDLGKFEMAAVPAGSYAAIAQFTGNADSDKVQTGRATVQVGDTNLDDVEVAVFPGTTVSGRVRVEGDRKVNVGRIAATLKSLQNATAANLGSDGGRTNVALDGTFIFHDVPDGNYRISFSSLPDGYYVSAEGAGDASVVVSHGHAGVLEVRLKPGAGQIQGTVYKSNDNNDEIAPSATVVLVPDERRATISDYYRVALADQSGKFSVGGVVPGRYTLFAWQNIERGQYMDPDFMQPYADLGMPVQVEEGSRNGDVQLHLAAPARDNSP